jgi:hypothetical protein
MKILKKILENSKFKLNKLKNKINLTKKYIINVESINKNKQLVIRDKNKKIKLIGDYNYYGLYNSETQMWVWSNAIPNVNSRHVKYINEFRLKQYIFEKNIDDTETDLFFYQFLSNDSMLINNLKYLTYIIDLLMYLSDDLYVFGRNYNDNIQIIGLKKINELF